MQARDAKASLAAWSRAREETRGLAPLARDLAPVAWATLDPWGDDPDERSRFAGLTALEASLRAGRWEDAARGAGTVRAAGRLLEGELAAQDWSLARIGAALSNGVFVLGARADGSDSPNEEQRLADVRAETKGVVRAVHVFGGDACGGDRMAERGLDGTVLSMRALVGKLPAGVGDFLRGTALLGALFRRCVRSLGVEISPPFVPHRHDGDPVAVPVSVLTFPQLGRLHADPRAALVGAELFASPLLSLRRDIACITCHDPARAFSRADPPALTFDAKVPPRNAPGLWNVAYEPTYFWDGRASSLDVQIEVAVARDMGGRWGEIVRRVGADPQLGPSFREALGEPSPATIRKAIVAFETGLIDDDTALDRFARREQPLEPDVSAGLDLFYGKARCSRCHRLPLTSGVSAPRFLRTELSSIGVPQKPGTTTLDPDRGRGAATKRPVDDGLFKVPSLRRVARTAPYFHNGAFGTLTEVLEFYEKGGGPGLGLTVPNLDPDLAPVRLTDAERAALLAFLERGL